MGLYFIKFEYLASFEELEYLVILCLHSCTPQLAGEEEQLVLRCSMFPLVHHSPQHSLVPHSLTFLVPVALTNGGRREKGREVLPPSIISPQ